MTDIAKLGLEIDTAGLLEGVRKLDALAEAAEKTGDAAGKLEAAHLRQSKSWMEQAVLTGKTTDEVIRYRIALNEMTGDAAASANMIANGIKQRREEAEAIKKVADEQKRLEEEYRSSAAGKLGTMIDDLINKFGRLALSVVSVGTALKAINDFAQAEAISNKLALTLETTGNKAGRSAEQLEEFASSLQSVTKFDDESIKRAQTVFVRMGAAAGDALDRATKLSLDLAEAMGTDAASAAQLLGRAMETAYGAQMLRRQGYLNDEQARTIRNLKELNRDAEAQEALFAALESRIGGLAEKTGERGLASAFAMLKNEAGEASESLGKLLSDTLELENVIRNLAKTVEVLRGGGLTGVFNAMRNALSSDVSYADAIRAQAEAERQKKEAAAKAVAYYEGGQRGLSPKQVDDEAAAFAVAAAARRDYDKAMTDSAEVGNKYLMQTLKVSDALKTRADVERMVAQQFANGNQAFIEGFKSQADAVDRITAAVVKKSGATKDSSKEVQAALLGMEKQIDLTGKQTEYERMLWEVQEGRWKKASAAEKEALLAKAKTLDALKKEEAELKKFDQDAAEYWKNYEANAKALQNLVIDTAKTQSQMVASTYASAEALKEEAKTLGMSSEEKMTYREETIKTKIAASEQEGGIWQLTDALKAQLAAEQELNAATRNKSRGDAMRKEADDAAAAWKQSADSIANSLTDALLRGFEDGADFAENFKNTLKNMFNTLILRPIIQMIVQPVSNAMSSILSPFSGGGKGAVPGMAGAGGFDLSSLFGGGGSSLLGYGGLGGLFSGSGGIFGAGAVGNSFAMGSMGQALGLSAVGLDTAGGLALTGLGTTMGAALPILGVALAAYMMFKKPRGGPKSGGSAGTIPGMERFFTPNDMDSDLQKIVDAQGGAYSQYYSALGGRGSGNAQFQFGYDTDPKGTASDRVRAGVSVNGQLLYDTGNIETGRDSEVTQARLQLEAKRALIAALKASDLPYDIAKIFDQVDIPAADEKLLDRVLSVSQAVSAIANMFDEVQEGATRIPAEVQAILDSVNLLTDPQVDVDRVIGVATAFASIYDLFNSDVLADGLQMYEESLSGANIAVRRGIQSVYDLIEAYDGSAESAQGLATATDAVYQASVQAIAQIHALKASIATMFENSATDYRLATMNPAQQRDYLRDQIASDTAALSTAEDINDITRYAQQINTNQQRLWTLLSPEERAASGNSFADAAEAANKLAQRQLDNAIKGIEASVAAMMTEVRGTFAQISTDLGAATASISASSAVQADAAAAQNNAAVIQRQRADVPLKIIVSDERIEVRQ